MNRGNTVSTTPSLPGNNSQPSNEVLRSISPQHFSDSVIQCFNVSVLEYFNVSVLQWLSASSGVPVCYHQRNTRFHPAFPAFDVLNAIGCLGCHWMPWMLWMLLQFVLHTTPWYTRCRRGYTVKRDLLGEVLHSNPSCRLCRACWPAKRIANWINWGVKSLGGM